MLNAHLHTSHVAGRTPRLIGRAWQIVDPLDARFQRRFEFYFAYCEGGFEERVLGDVQVVLAKPRCRLEPILARFDDVAPASRLDTRCSTS